MAKWLDQDEWIKESGRNMNQVLDYPGSEWTLECLKVGDHDGCANSTGNRCRRADCRES